MTVSVFRRAWIRSSGVAASAAYGVVAGVVIALLLFPLESLTRSLGEHDPTATAQAVATPKVAAFQQLAAVQPLPAVRFADFGDEQLSPDARHVAHWVADSRDNAQHDFVIVDKRLAMVYVFDANARMRGASPVLLGAAIGDYSVPGIGTRALSDISFEERTTPAGRFLAQQGPNAQGEDVVWVDYEAAVSMHRVRATVASERRLARLASESPHDNRISWGCINVPVAFFEQLLQPVFADRKAVVYVLPEARSVEQVFGSYDVAARHRVPSPG